jgi:polysaccharide export outer membrane protein
MKLIYRLPYVFLLLSFCSCYHNKRMIYLQDKHYSQSTVTNVENKKTAYRIQPFDILSIQIKSAGDRDISNVFNLIQYQNSMMVSPGNLYLEGYSVDATGKITLPVLGDIVVKDLTLEGAQKLIQLNVDKYLKQATAIIKLTSFKVTVLGEVKNPGYYYVYNNQATVLEALGLAGDLTPVGNRQHIKLIRQLESGSQVVLLDLTDPNLLKSDHYYLTPGDVLYVEPFKARSKRTNLELLTVVFSGLTTAVLILSYINANN